MCADKEAAAIDMMICCVSCGIAEVDEIKLKKCAACQLVRYCSVKCQKEHRWKHKGECKKRVAELRDEILFKQPESSHLKDCPICLLPLSPGEFGMQSCCSKMICLGCSLANRRHERGELLELKCPYCRQPTEVTQKEAEENNKKRIEANDPSAINLMGKLCYEKGDHVSALEYWNKAAGLGDAESQFQLSIMYFHGEGVEKDMKKWLSHTEEAAIGGHPIARHNLGAHEEKRGRMDRAMKHFIIAANLGFHDSLQIVRKGYSAGYVTKEDFAATLRAYQIAIDATKSPQRELVAEARKKFNSVSAHH
jgi:hypothetical protein